MRTKNILIIAGVAMVASTGAYAANENIPTSRAYVDANVSTKQGILQKQSSNNVAVTFPTTVGGTPGTRTINTSLGSSTSDTALATTGAINTGLNAKQGNINGTANTVVTYTGTSGGTASKAVYNSGSAYDGQTTNLTEAQHVNTAVQNGFNAHLSCNNAPDCTLWNVNTLSGTYVPQSNQ